MIVATVVGVKANRGRSGRAASYVLSLLLAGLVSGPGEARTLHKAAQASYEGSESLLTIIPRVDVSCILRSWRIVGVDVCVRDGTPRAHFGIFRECRGCWGATLAPARPPGG